MLTTFALFALVLAILVIAWTLWGVFLQFGLRWAKVSGITTARLVLVTASVAAAQVVVTLLFRLASPSSVVGATALALLELAAAIAIPCLLIAGVFKATLRRSFQAWLLTLVPTIGMIAFSVLILRPFFFQAFVISSNAMAPTLLGQHCLARCPQCGEPNFCSFRQIQASQVQAGQSALPMMICTNFHVTEIPNVNPRQFSGDRILVAKFLAPRRWDIVVFRFPANPSVAYVQRLVGLPGETVHIEDGAVWINGKRLDPPSSIRGLKYVDELPGSYLEMSGTKVNPAVLADDEYFVLGDFSAQSADSRIWDQGADGHPRYAVPKSHLKGVVTHIYWPPNRWRTFR